MLNSEGDAKIGDFGIAQRALSDQTQVMGMFGSPTYMSPEQARDDDLTPLTDIYSFGVVMYEVLAGRPPFRARGFSGLLNKILNEEPAALSEFRSDIPAELAAVVDKAMQKAVKDRYQSGAEIAADLAAIMEERRFEGRQEKTISPEQRFEQVRDLSFFNDFSDAELEEVVDVGVWENPAEGETVVEAGDSAESFFVVVEGEVAVEVEGRVIAHLSKGDCVGEMGYLASGARSATVTAVGGVTLLKIDAALIEWASIPCQMRFNKAFVRVLINRLAETSQRLAQHLN